MNKWTVTSNVINGKFYYAVCRVKNLSEPIHSGNLEFATGYLEDINEAEQIAKNLNDNIGGLCK